MAKRQRDHKAEYARRLARAKAAGYRSPYEVRKARKALRLKPTQPVIPKDKLLGKTPSEYRHNKDDRLWSLAHSRVPRSKYKAGRGPRYDQSYLKAYVDKRKNKTHDEVMDDLKAYLQEHEGLSDEEWEANYEDR
jgi:hypothetical protein